MKATVSTEHMEKVHEREPVAIARAREKVEKAQDSPAYQANFRRAQALMNKAMAQPKPVQAIVWLHRSVDAWAQNIESVAACKAGCDHCCHVPLMISRAEALYIGKAIGREPVALKTAEMDPSRLTRAGYDNPCPFLVNKQCSIHAHRPAECRSLFNLDDDNLLCELREGEAIHVPYAEKSTIAKAEALISEGKMADIREWFPKGKN